MLDTLFYGITAITMCDEAPLLQDAFVGVHEGKIAYVGAQAPQEDARLRVNGKNRLLMPGLINTHGHTAMCVMRGCADDYPLQAWLNDHIFPREARMTERDIFAGVRLGIAESIASGITSTTDMYMNLPAMARAAMEIGVRANLSNAIVCMDQRNYSFEKDNSTREMREILKHGLHQACNGRIRLDAGIHAEYTSEPRQWKDMLALAQEEGLGLQLHLSETKTEHQGCVARYGKTPARMFYEAGIFDVPVTAAHCVWVTEEDMRLMAEKGVTCAHNPISNLKLGSGIAPVIRMQQSGVNVSLGTDGCCSNNSLDFFEEMKTAALLQKGISLDPTCMNAYETLKLATVNGAKAQGREDEVGRIKVGYDADLIMLDLDQPHLTPCLDPIGMVVYAARGSDVCFTMVQGRVLYENGEYYTLDIEAVKREARACSLHLQGEEV